ncbi:MAG: hypothetical protein US67_C0040G0001, partial [Candidatus Woesebacteria bacterium GW2011_GWD1_38_10]
RYRRRRPPPLPRDSKETDRDPRDSDGVGREYARVEGVK